MIPYTIMPEYPSWSKEVTLDNMQNYLNRPAKEWRDYILRNYLVIENNIGRIIGDNAFVLPNTKLEHLTVYPQFVHAATRVVFNIETAAYICPCESIKARFDFLDSITHAQALLCILLQTIAEDTRDFNAYYELSAELLKGSQECRESAKYLLSLINAQFIQDEVTQRAYDKAKEMIEAYKE